MNKVISIHLHGVAFQLEEGGYDALRAYLDQAARHLAANPDQAEILADIEQAIGDRLRALLNSGRNVVLTPEVESVIAAVGPVSDGSATAPEEAPGAKPATGEQTAQPSAAQPSSAKRLFRLRAGAKMHGVCAGFSAYTGIDAIIIRLLAVGLVVGASGFAGLIALFVGSGESAVATGFFGLMFALLAYHLLVAFIPEAKTPEEKAAAAGPSPTAQEFIRLAKDGYYAGMKSLGDRHARRAWKRKFRREMRHWKHNYRWEVHAEGLPPRTPGTPPGAPSPDYYPGQPVLSTLKALLRLLGVSAVLSLVFTKSVFGFPLPPALPLWAGVLLLIFAYKVFTAPINALRHASAARHFGQPWSPVTELWHGLLALLLVVFGLWMADRFVPGFHAALLDLPAFLHNAADAVQHWWAGGNLERQ